MRDRTGGFDFKKTEGNTYHGKGAVPGAGFGNFARLVIEVQSAEPHHVLRLDAKHLGLLQIVSSTYQEMQHVIVQGCGKSSGTFQKDFQP